MNELRLWLSQTLLWLACEAAPPTLAGLQVVQTVSDYWEEEEASNEPFDHAR